MKLPEFVKRFLPESAFAKNVSVLVGGTALAQAITVLASPLLTRLYTPDDFGTLAVFASFLSIAAVIASLRYELAIPLPEDDKTAANVLALSLSIVVGNSLLAGILVWLFGGKVLDVINAPQLRPYLWLLPIGIFGVGTYQVLNYWAIRKKAFNRVAQTELNRSMAQVATQAGVGLALNGPFGLILGQVVGQAMGSTTLATLAWRKDKEALSAINKQEMLLVAERYKRFPVFSSWAALFNALSSQLPIFTLSYLFGPVVTGLYSLGHRVLQTPMSLVGQSIGQVFFSSAAEANRSGNISTITRGVFQKLVQVGLPVIMLIGIAAPELFAFIFGSEWQEAGVYAQWLAPWLLLVFVSSPLSTLPSVLEKQHFDTLFQAILLSSRIVSLFIGAALGNELLAIALFALVSALCWFGFMLWNIRLSGNNVGLVLGIIVKELVLAVFMTLPVVIVKVFSSSIIMLIITVIISAVIIAYRCFNLLARREHSKLFSN